MRPALIFALLLMVPPGALVAQAGPDEGASPPLVTGALSVVAEWSEVADRGRLHLGGWGGLILGHRVLVGGGGFTMLERVELPASEASSGFELKMGYGGLVLQLFQPLGKRITTGLGLLVGGGHAEVRDRLAGLEVGVDNFMVVEPGLHFSYSLLDGVHLGASGGYRVIWGVDDLPRISARDLEAPTLSVSLRFGGG